MKAAATKKKADEEKARFNTFDGLYHNKDGSKEFLDGNQVRGANLGLIGKSS